MTDREIIKTLVNVIEPSTVTEEALKQIIIGLLESESPIRRRRRNRRRNRKQLRPRRSPAENQSTGQRQRRAEKQDGPFRRSRMN